nr:uncharacterized protein CTRU02_05424 [Colletotrichum truncatum]KAF6793867.1 hypothetical protein CTRU02_05424 [Colletotrichum truncatum]
MELNKIIYVLQQKFYDNPELREENQIWLRTFDSQSRARTDSCIAMGGIFKAISKMIDFLRTIVTPNEEPYAHDELKKVHGIIKSMSSGNFNYLLYLLCTVGNIMLHLANPRFQNESSSLATNKQ